MGKKIHAYAGPALSMYIHNYRQRKKERLVFEAADLSDRVINGLHYHYLRIRRAHPLVRYLSYKSLYTSILFTPAILSILSVLSIYFILRSRQSGLTHVF